MSFKNKRSCYIFGYIVELCVEKMAKFLKFWSNYGYWKSLISALLICNLAFWLSIYSPKKKGWKRERERERERECCRCMLAGRHQIHSSRNRNGFSRTGFVCIYFCQKQLASFELIQFIARECKPSWTGRSRIFQTPKQAVSKVFFSANLSSKKVLTHLQKCILLLPSRLL